MRGKAVPAALPDVTHGITPAYAGKSLFCFTAAVPIQDHPRVCGEKSPSPAPCTRATGSPPRVRGKAAETYEKVVTYRITPAYAGKSLCPCLVRRSPEDHPRVCGEKMVSMIPHRRSRGSPPRVRGKGHDGVTHVLNLGITPAYAGKRDRPRSGPGTTRDHPRVCGEKIYCDEVLPTDTGSPPRMRGKGLLQIFVPEPFGITPAYAGKRTADQSDR